ncbi:MAG: hypothetical protein WCP66_08410 [Methylococcales bacterium]
MNSEADLLNSLDDAQGRNPIEFPFGFYIEDNQRDTNGGSFFWYMTKNELQHAIRNDLIDALTDGQSSDIQYVKDEIAELFESSEDDDLINHLNVILAELELHLQFLGSFEELCKGKDEWTKFFRESYREECMEDIEGMPTKKLQSPIKYNEQEDFAEFVAEYMV